MKSNKNTRVTKDSTPGGEGETPGNAYHHPPSTMRETMNHEAMCHVAGPSQCGAYGCAANQKSHPRHRKGPASSSIDRYLYLRDGFTWRPVTRTRILFSLLFWFSIAVMTLGPLFLFIFAWVYSWPFTPILPSPLPPPCERERLFGTPLLAFLLSSSFPFVLSHETRVFIDLMILAGCEVGVWAARFVWST